jgi:hypothetical protein
MLYMVIEGFAPGRLEQVGERFRAQGRMMPEGVNYVNSWMEANGSACYQVMEAPTRELLDQWIANWKDLVEFEVVPVQTSAEFWEKRSAGA